MDNIKQVFNSIFAKYQRKDYFSDKALIKSKLEYARQFNLNSGKGIQKFFGQVKYWKV